MLVSNTIHSLKKFFISNSKNISEQKQNSNFGEKEEDLYIIDLCNGFYQLPKFVPETSIKINPRIFKPNLFSFYNDTNEITDKDILDYIKGILTTTYFLSQNNKKNIFDDLSAIADKNKNISFEINELNFSEEGKPYISLCVNFYDRKRKDFCGENISIYLSYLKIDDITFNINFNIEYQENKKEYILIYKKINNLISNLITNSRSSNHITFKSS